MSENREYPPITLIELRGEGQDLVVSVECADRPGDSTAPPRLTPNPRGSDA